jgi:hypothetical protein
MPAIIQPYRMRCTISEDATGLRITIPPKSRIFTILIFSFLAATWIGVGFAGWTIFTSLQAEHVFGRYSSVGSVVGLILAAMWIFGELMLVLSVLYAMGGCDTILVTSDGLTRKTTFFGIGWGGRYMASQIRDLRFRLRERIGGTGRSPTFRPSGIVFAYGSRTIRFADGIEESEAADVIRRIRQYCPIESTSPAPAERPGAA